MEERGGAEREILREVEDWRENKGKRGVCVGKERKGEDAKEVRWIEMKERKQEPIGGKGKEGNGKRRENGEKKWRKKRERGKEMREG